MTETSWWLRGDWDNSGKNAHLAAISWSNA